MMWRRDKFLCVGTVAIVLLVAGAWGLSYWRGGALAYIAAPVSDAEGDTSQSTFIVSLSAGEVEGYYHWARKVAPSHVKISPYVGHVPYTPSVDMPIGLSWFTRRDQWPGRQWRVLFAPSPTPPWFVRMGLYTEAQDNSVQGYFDDRSYLIGFPYWFLFVITTALASWPWFGVFRRHRRTVQGLCARCGYDLRASPGRCPECGLQSCAS